MNNRHALRLTVLILGLALSASLAPSQTPKTPLPVEVHFSPKGGCTEAVVKELNAAKHLIRVQAYSFTSAPIAKALLDAKNRGVEVEVIVDRSQEGAQNSPAAMLKRSGVQVLVDSKHAIAHNKIMVIDDEVVITGSFNFTKAAEERNAENLLVIRDRDLATIYTKNWEAHLKHSAVY